MSYELVPVPYDQLDISRPLWLSFVGQIAERERRPIERLLADVYVGAITLILVCNIENRQPVALCGYSIISGLTGNRYLIRWLTGESAGQWTHLYARLESYFKEQFQCSGGAAIARPGWSKFLKANGYRLTHVEYTKDF